MCDLTFIARESDALLLVEKSNELQDEEASYRRRKNAVIILQRVKSLTPPRGVINDNGDSFHYLIASGILYLTVTDSMYPEKLAVCFLNEIQQAFEDRLKTEFGPTANHAELISKLQRAYYFTRFDRFIEQKRREYQDMQYPKSMQRLNVSLNEVHSIMHENLQSIMKRGKKIEAIAVEAQNFADTTSKFKKASAMMLFRMRMKKYLPLLFLFIFVIGALILWIFFM